MKATGKVVPQLIAALLVIAALAFGTRQAVANSTANVLACATGVPSCNADGDCTSYCVNNPPESTAKCFNHCCECLL
jgi:hypothetical protein